MISIIEMTTSPSVTVEDPSQSTSTVMINDFTMVIDFIIDIIIATALISANAVLVVVAMIAGSVVVIICIRNRRQKSMPGISELEVKNN